MNNFSDNRMAKDKVSSKVNNRINTNVSSGNSSQTTVKSNDNRRTMYQNKNRESHHYEQSDRGVSDSTYSSSLSTDYSSNSSGRYESDRPFSSSSSSGTGPYSYEQRYSQQVTNISPTGYVSSGTPKVSLSSQSPVYSSTGYTSGSSGIINTRVENTHSSLITPSGYTRDYSTRSSSGNVHTTNNPYTVENLSNNSYINRTNTVDYSNVRLSSQSPIPPSTSFTSNGGKIKTGIETINRDISTSRYQFKDHGIKISRGNIQGTGSLTEGKYGMYSGGIVHPAYTLNSNAAEKLFSYRNTSFESAGLQINSKSTYILSSGFSKNSISIGKAPLTGIANYGMNAAIGTMVSSDDTGVQALGYATMGAKMLSGKLAGVYGLNANASQQLFGIQTKTIENPLFTYRSGGMNLLTSGYEVKSLKIGKFKVTYSNGRLPFSDNKFSRFSISSNNQVKFGADSVTNLSRKIPGRYKFDNRVANIFINGKPASYLNKKGFEPIFSIAGKKRLIPSKIIDFRFNIKPGRQMIPLYNKKMPVQKSAQIADTLKQVAAGTEKLGINTAVKTTIGTRINFGKRLLAKGNKGNIKSIKTLIKKDNLKKKTASQLWKARRKKAWKSIFRRKGLLNSSAVGASVTGVSPVMGMLIKLFGSKMGVLVSIPIFLKLFISFLAAGSNGGGPMPIIYVMFGGQMTVVSADGTKQNVKIKEYLTTEVPAVREAKINELVGDINKSIIKDRLNIFAGSADYIRISIDGIGIEDGTVLTFDKNTELSVIKEEFEKYFYKSENLVTLLQPIYTVKVMMDYNFTISENEAKDLVSDMIGKLIYLSNPGKVQNHDMNCPRGATCSLKFCPYRFGTSVDEVCAGVQDLDDPSKIFALTDCPNPSSTKYHSDDASKPCNSCDHYYYTCNGHPCTDDHHDSSCYDPITGALDCDTDSHTSHSGCSPNYCSNTDSCSNRTKHRGCSGYKHCEGHKVLKLNISLDGIYTLLYEYFDKPIEELSAKADRTDEEEKKLKNLRAFYDIAREMIKVVYKDFDKEQAALTVKDLDNISFVSGSRAGRPNIIRLAKSQVGMAGGEPYWKFMGFNYRVEWCACFVSWVMNKDGLDMKFAECVDGTLKCRDRSDWTMVYGSPTDCAPGDLIFFNWHDGGKDVDHVGFIVGRDDTYVYTIEGNSNDRVRIWRYDLTNICLYGYAYYNN